MPSPSPLANWGIFFAPKRIKMATRTKTSSPPLKPNTAKLVFIKLFPRGIVAGRFFEFLDALAQSLGKLGNFFRAKKDQNGNENQNQLSATQAQHCKTC